MPTFAGSSNADILSDNPGPWSITAGARGGKAGGASSVGRPGLMGASVDPIVVCVAGRVSSQAVTFRNASVDVGFMLADPSEDFLSTGSALAQSLAGGSRAVRSQGVY